MNCFIREVGDAKWLKQEDIIELIPHPYFITSNKLIQIPLSSQGITLLLEVTYKSLAGRHIFGRVFKLSKHNGSFHEDEALPVMITCIQELHIQAREKGCQTLASHYDELILRLIDSYQTMCTYIEKGMETCTTNHAETKSFIELEQSLMFGHWLHPTPKSRQGMTQWQQQMYAPELEGKFPLHFFEVEKSLVKEYHSTDFRPTTMIENLLKDYGYDSSATSKTYYPMHPLQAQWLIQQQHVKKAMDQGLIRYLGPIGPEFSATSSIRSVYNENEAWMFKFSIPVKVTNSLRVNKAHELYAGVVMADVFNNLPFKEQHPNFHIINDPASLSLALPCSEEENGFEVIIRENPFPKGKNKGLISVAALIQDPLPGQHSILKQLINKQAKTEGKSNEEVAWKWFEQYWDKAILPMFCLYEQYGIALEAHQQNSLLDVSNIYPQDYYFRDNQGYYLSNNYKKALVKITPALANRAELFYEEKLIHDRFAYYLFINHVFSIVHRFGADQILEEEHLLFWLQEKLHVLSKNFSKGGKGFVDYLLHTPTIACKANLLTSFHDVDELLAEMEQAVYTSIPNPFCTANLSSDKESIYATAFSV
ncbi:IucA/IucC family siderophore biosynthesis protein [Bacillus sp. THAF10]|uniref:IucA/IucC family protein n=1 Tax=Bacillus sp. THAF10 TaxID=2587848 RepID=UPI0020A69A65|nr:IucA/IucC family protein [Bacillus sp. THAF10]